MIESIWFWIATSTTASLVCYFVLFWFIEKRKHLDLDRVLKAYDLMAIIFSLFSLLVSWMWFYYVGIVLAYPAFFLSLFLLLRSVKLYAYTKLQKATILLLSVSLLSNIYWICKYF